MHVFKEKRDPTSKLEGMKSDVRKRKFAILRNISQMKKANLKLEADIKKRAKAGDLIDAKLLAAELVRCRKTVSRLCDACTTADCLISQLTTQASMLRLQGCLKSSTEVMHAVSTLVKLPDFRQTMHELSKEMMKMGLIQETIQDSMESTMGDPEDLDEATEMEVKKVLSELAIDVSTRAPDAVAGSVPVGVPVRSESQPAADLTSSVEVDDHEDIVEMQARLAALRN